MTIEQDIVAHYQHGSLEQALLAGLVAAGKDPDKLTADDLAAADEFHIGGRQATIDLAAEIAPTAGMHLLDIGSGVGGPSRFFAQNYDCRVTGVDLSEEYVVTAGALARRTALDGRVAYRVASALELPFPDNSFDAAYMQHVGMNIADKARLFHEVHRVLKPGATFALYDIMRTGDGPLAFPVPWASNEAGSFVERREVYRALLSADGFEVIKERDRGQIALEVYRARAANLSTKGGLPPLGTHILMGASAPQKIANMLSLVEAGTIAPVEMICRRVEINPHAGNV
jgi:ubiquinone/menaquinone biosynthesis C-methylase UbiE